MSVASRVLHTRWLVRAPIGLYRAGLGFLLGSRLLLLEHRGRVSGRLRSVVLEVVHRPAPDRFVVMAGLGPRSQWYRNVLADPRTVVSAGTRRRVQALAHPLPPDDVVRLLTDYAAGNRRAWEALAPVLREWAEPLAAQTGESDWRRVVPGVELTLLDALSSTRRPS
ncbi:nitroreductase family deazaflavin-dependent oxidoreductase [Cellulosimicrobium arenosum]|uniref:Nitroreductase family deazaflavin-dependent oxidoreductase n=1 Tax=Cellulosimicrobium arenosum TaxID=2708133 RepID=A0A927IZH6_9MICO|nr:nitroreductase family deazaflavin-dependent oxidoreductase [Cellulosimicrobium arenosum]MBD8078564.1 nitroreductase family deazaflavin-dependent oxidoreductase [Cellulosimicrobium arenosum]